MDSFPGTFVDVRDVAAAHVAALTSDAAAGQRFILTGGTPEHGPVRMTALGPIVQVSLSLSLSLPLSLSPIVQAMHQRPRRVRVCVHVCACERVAACVREHVRERERVLGPCGSMRSCV